MTEFKAGPRRPLRAGVGFSVVLVGGALAAWAALGTDVRARFTVLQILTFILFLAVMVTMMLAIGFCSVRADDSGLTLRNGLRTHRVPWGSIAGVTFPEGESWPTLHLVPDSGINDTDTLGVMGIQASDGAYAREQFTRLRAAVASHLTTDEDPGIWP